MLSSCEVHAKFMRKFGETRGFQAAISGDATGKFFPRRVKDDDS